MPFWLKKRLMEAAGGDGDSAGGGDPNKGAGDKSGAGDGDQNKNANKPSDKPSDKEAELLREVMDKKTKIKELETKIKAFDGIDPAEVKKLLEEKKAAEQVAAKKELEALEKAGEFEKVREQMVEAHKNDLKGMQDAVDQAIAKVTAQSNLIDQLTVGQLFSNSEFINEKLHLPASKVRILYGANFDRDEQGNVVGYNKPRGESGRAPLVDGNGNPLPFEQALQKLVEADPDKDRIMKATVKPGAGSNSQLNSKKSDDGSNKAFGRSRIASAISNGVLAEPSSLNMKVGR